jgi:hypothetical protein
MFTVNHVGPPYLSCLNWISFCCLHKRLVGLQLTRTDDVASFNSRLVSIFRNFMMVHRSFDACATLLLFAPVFLVFF